MRIAHISDIHNAELIRILRLYSGGGQELIVEKRRSKQ